VNNIKDIFEVILMISGIAYWIETLVKIKMIIDKGVDKE
jgi:hypothetical protein